jgi:hypothetical protein
VLLVAIRARSLQTSFSTADTTLPFPLEPTTLRNLLITVVAVAGLSSCLNALESAPSKQQHQSFGWVRTIDGWERSGVVAPSLPTNRSATIDPAVVALFQLGTSVFFLLAFPPKVGRKRKTVMASQLDVGSSLLASA